MDHNDLAWAIDGALQEHERRTRRDSFIAAAVTGLCANPSYDASETAITGWAIRQADAVLAALDKEASK